MLILCDGPVGDFSSVWNVVWSVAGTSDGLMQNVFRNGGEGSEGLLLLGGDEQYRSAEQSKRDRNF
jgi:hypothetical protein